MIFGQHDLLFGVPPARPPSVVGMIISEYITQDT